MIGHIFLGALLGWIAAGAALVSGAGIATALALCPLVGCGATLAMAGLSLALAADARRAPAAA